ncbi:MAG: hypothetical protein M3460_27200 [Actinomycetota bacterium]|nr:hypothetical protein [Actinomycetota bacterium]
MNPAIEQLRRLCRFGFNGERLFNQDGQLDLVHYTRDFQGVREVVLVYSERKALAYRTRDMLDPESPLHVTENAVEWRLHGDVVTVVNALLSLPVPEPTDIAAQASAATFDTVPTTALNAPDQPDQPIPPAAAEFTERFLANPDAGNHTEERRGE